MKVLTLSLLLLLAGCKDATDPSTSRLKSLTRTKEPAPTEAAAPVVYLQPFSDLSAATLKGLQQRLRRIFPVVHTLPTAALPRMAWYAPRGRYRADSLLRWLAARIPDGAVVLGLTATDISTTKGKHADWGVMGLGQMPGKACVSSGFRLTKGKGAEEALFKVGIHELGHTQGLPHCPIRSCFMRDAEGGNPTGEEREFCPSCRSRLLARGWRL